MLHRAWIIGFIPLIALACGDLSAPVGPEIEGPLFNHHRGQGGGNGGNDDGGSETDPGEDSRALWVFHSELADGTPSRIRGDGRAANGDPTPVDAGYEGEVCAVRAKIFWYDPSLSQSGDAVFDADGEHRRTRCGDARYLEFHVDGGVDRDAPFMNVRDVMGLAAGESRDQVLNLTNADIGGCERLVFHGGIRVTREAGNAEGSAGLWTVETLGDHVASCQRWQRGSWTDTGTGYPLPFRATITELPAGS